MFNNQLYNTVFFNVWTYFKSGFCDKIVLWCCTINALSFSVLTTNVYHGYQWYHYKDADPFGVYILICRALTQATVFDALGVRMAWIKLYSEGTSSPCQ